MSIDWAVIVVFHQGDWRWEDGTQVNYHKWESMSSTEDFQCLQLNSQGENKNHTRYRGVSFANINYIMVFLQSPRAGPIKPATSASHLFVRVIQIASYYRSTDLYRNCSCHCHVSSEVMQTLWLVSVFIPVVFVVICVLDLINVITELLFFFQGKNRL